MASRFLFRRIDNSQLIIFRIFFGILVSLECFGAIATGWVRENLVEPEFTFNFIGFDWLQPLPGPWMYFYFILMGTCGICIALGYRYRLSIISFTLMWTTVYLMQKTSYNNHYYLLIIISFLMCLFPANRSRSLDARFHPSLRADSMFNYVRWIIIAQLFIVYTYAAIAKLYGDWLDLSFIRLLMQSKADYFLIGNWLQQHWVLASVCTVGILFDLLIVPALLWKPTRKFAFVFSIFFHLFNSVVFQIGIFPYLSLAFTVFFFEPETIRKLFFPNKSPYHPVEGARPPYANLLTAALGLFLFIQLVLPLRHHLFEDDVLWTEEGHRMSWRMMLRSREGQIRFIAVDKKTNTRFTVDLRDYLTEKQMNRVAAYPDFIWQFAQHVKEGYARSGMDVAVYVRSRISINGRPMKVFIDPSVDLGSEPWYHFRHHYWIMPSQLSAIEKGGPERGLDGN